MITGLVSNANEKVLKWTDSFDDERHVQSYTSSPPRHVSEVDLRSKRHRPRTDSASGTQHLSAGRGLEELMVQVAAQCAQHLTCDRFAIRSAMTAIRNAFTPTRERQPMAFAPGERRTSTRVCVE